jgi:iron complex outermembrane recepter protein
MRFIKKITPSIAFILGSNLAFAVQERYLEETIVTAQKREQPIQSVPMSITAFQDKQLDTLGISGVGNLVDNVVPFIRFNPHGNNATTIIATIRGNGPTDPAPVTRESNVPFYIDGVYLGRTQGLSMDLLDLRRIEILRGPQGTLYGRNSTAGAVNLIQNKPTGEIGVKQTLRAGRYDEIKNITHINFPEFLGLKTKFDYLYSKRDGWVKNSAPNQRDYHESRQNGGQMSISWQSADSISVDYTFNDSTVEDTQPYFQVLQDNLGLFGNEIDRRTATRFPVTPLAPTITDMNLHTLTANWTPNESLTVKSISAYRELEEDGNNNYAGALYFGGLIATEIFEAEQFTQELQLIGNHGNFEWISGLYYFKELTDQTTQLLFTLGVEGGELVSIPPTTGGLPPTIVDAQAESLAIYGQGTWAFNEKLYLTVGGRYTEDKKSGNRQQFITQLFNIDSEHFDPSITFKYSLTDDISTYVKWSTAYKAAGVNIRSITFLPYEEEVIKTWEIGLKSQYFDKRIKFNAALFNNRYADMQFDFIDPNNITVNETQNALKQAEVNGLELDLSVVPIPGLVLALRYAYLDGDIPPQPNPRKSGVIQNFEMTQTPNHAGSMTIDYSFAPWSFATLAAHMDIVSTDHYAMVSTPGAKLDGYTLVNGGLTLSEIQFGHGNGNLSASLWAKNILDEEYAIVGFPAGSLPNSIVQAFGTPRTYGVNLTYDF